MSEPEDPGVHLEPEAEGAPLPGEEELASLAAIWLRGDAIVGTVASVAGASGTHDYKLQRVNVQGAHVELVWLRAPTLPEFIEISVSIDRPAHGEVTPDAQDGRWAIECVCGWSWVAQDDSALSEATVHEEMARHLADPEPPGPWPGDEALVDCTQYGVPGTRWCPVTRVLPPSSAGVYPIKVLIPDRGEGQYKRTEIQEVRTPNRIRDMLMDIERATGTRVRREADGYSMTMIQAGGGDAPMSIEPS